MMLALMGCAQSANATVKTAAANTRATSTSNVTRTVDFSDCCAMAQPSATASCARLGSGGCELVHPQRNFLSASSSAMTSAASSQRCHGRTSSCSLSRQVVAVSPRSVLERNCQAASNELLHHEYLVQQHRW